MKKTLSIFLALALILAGGYVLFEPQLTLGDYDEFTVSQEVYGEITIDCTEPVNMAPAIYGLTGGTGVGTSTCTVTTSDTDGYQATLSASTSPAMTTGSYFFTDYIQTNSTTVPEYTWYSVPPTSTSSFGYTVEGDDTAQFFLDDGSICNAGASNAAYSCWLNASTSQQLIADRNSEATSGSDTDIGFRAEVQSGRNQESGTYTATIGVTATNK